MKKLISGIATLATAAAMSIGIAAAPAHAWSEDYKGPYLCYGNGDTATWMQITSWNISSTTRRYHISYRENLTTNGSSFRRIDQGSTTVRNNSAYDNNPQDFYWNGSGLGSRSFKAYWYEIAGNVPVYTVTCTITQ